MRAIRLWMLSLHGSNYDVIFMIPTTWPDRKVLFYCMAWHQFKVHFFRRVHMSSMPDLVANIEAPSRSDASWKARAMPALLAGVLGAVLVYSMGFTEIPTLHNAAHDGRHAAGFPCH